MQSARVAEQLTWQQEQQAKSQKLMEYWWIDILERTGVCSSSMKIHT